MAELIDHVELDESQEADIREGGVVWIHDNGTAQDIKLDAKAAMLLFDFLLLHQGRLIRHRDAAAKVKAYNAEMDARNRAAVENREKPWLPIQPGEEF
ncbi:MAG: hypothetical protein ACJ788_03175 [Ktedonobacteraceae bacterium]